MTQKIEILKNIVAVAVITILTGNFATAQPGGQQGPPPLPSDKQIEKMVENLDKELSLNDEQETQVSKLYFAHFNKVEAKMKSSQRVSREVMESLDKDLEKEVKAGLTKDQQKQYTAYLKEQEKQRSNQRPQGRR